MVSPCIRVFARGDARELRASATTAGEAEPALRYLADFLEQGPRGMVEAADLERLVLVLDGATPRAVPVVVNDGREERCYFLSPRVHYVDYMRVELAKMEDNAAARWLSAAVAVLGGMAAPLGFNRCVSANNWFFTTNPLASLDAGELASVVAVLARRYPTMPIVFRSVDARTQDRRAAFVEAGFRLVINRPVFEWTPETMRNGPRRPRRHVRDELRLLDRLPWESDARLAPADAARVAALYRGLYLEKHSGYNARYTERFFRALGESGLVRFALLRRAGEIIAFVTYAVEPTRIVGAVVGYDLGLDRREYPLYRSAMAMLLQLSIDADRTLFLSTGAAEFKRQRGAYEWLEHEAVYDCHLPAPKRLPWWAFGKLLDAAVGSLDTGKM
jgi:hypothetical protein